LLHAYLPKVADFIEGYESGVVYETDFKAGQQSFGLTRIEAIKFMKSIIKLGVVEFAVFFTQTC